MLVHYLLSSIVLAQFASAWFAASHIVESGLPQLGTAVQVENVFVKNSYSWALKRQI